MFRSAAAARIKRGLARKSSDRFVIFFVLVLPLILKEKRKKKCNKENENEVKKKTRYHFRNCAFLFSRQEH
jgi:hypothetical protein